MFFVDTPSAVAADYGCAYTLEVKDDGGSLLHVTSGWVALESKDRETLVPMGASCETRPGIGPGTAYFNDASQAFRDALSKVDFEHNATIRSAALTSVLDQARPRDTLTLWYLFKRFDGQDRERLYDKLASFVPPPPGVTREGLLRFDEKMMEQWEQVLGFTWTSYAGKGVPSQKLKQLVPK